MVAITDKNTGLDPQMWEAVQARDPKADGRFVYGVSSTGIYCRPSRRPAARRVAFFDRARPRPPGSGPANAACPARKPPAPVWSAGSANTSKSDRTNHVPCPPWRNWARWLATVLYTCSGRSKRPPGSRRNSTRQPGVSTGSRRWSKTGKTSQQRFMKRRSVRPAGCTRPRRSIWA